MTHTAIHYLCDRGLAPRRAGEMFFFARRPDPGRPGSLARSAAAGQPAVRRSDDRTAEAPDPRPRPGLHRPQLRRPVRPTLTAAGKAELVAFRVTEHHVVFVFRHHARAE